MASGRALGPIGGFLEELNFVLNSIRSRGVKHYFRAILMGFGMVLAANKLVFESSDSALRSVTLQLETASATAKYADTYRELDDTIRAVSQRLPPNEDPAGWFLTAVVDSLKSEGLVAQSISPVQQFDVSSFKVLSMTLNFKAKFSQTANWIARVEGSKKLLHISSLTLRKDPEKMGQNEVVVIVSSLVPRGRL